MTWARTPHEDAALRRSLGRLAHIGIRIAVADAGTNSAFGEFIRGIPGVTVTTPGEPGLVAQVRASLRLAATFETPFVLYTEPDKEGFFEHGLVEFVTAATAGEPRLTLASRSDDSFATF